MALRAVFGQDEASHGAMRYRVDSDGLVRVPREAVPFLIGTGGFAVAKTNEAPAESGVAGLRRHEAVGGSCDGRDYPSDQHGDVTIPAATALELMAHGAVPAPQTVAPTPTSVAGSWAKG